MTEVLQLSPDIVSYVQKAMMPLMDRILTLEKHIANADLSVKDAYLGIEKIYDQLDEIKQLIKGSVG